MLLYHIYQQHQRDTLARKNERKRKREGEGPVRLAFPVYDMITCYKTITLSF